MKLRKYTKVFKNRGSAYKFYDRVGRAWENGDMGKEYMPNIEHQDYRENGRLKMKYTVTYFRGKYVSKITYRQDDIYGNNAKDAIAKFKKAIKEGITGYTPVVKGAKFKLERGGMKLYTITHYLKKNK